MTMTSRSSPRQHLATTAMLGTSTAAWFAAWKGKKSASQDEAPAPQDAPARTGGDQAEAVARWLASGDE
jgi:hypothetical protein